MPVLFRQSGWPVLKNIGWNLALLVLGSLLCGVSINGILIPHRFVSGGVTGLALVIHYLLPPVPVAVIYVLANVPLFIAGWFFISRRFFLYSVVGMLLFAGAVAWVDIDVPIRDKLLAALLAGLIQGAGSGIILKSMGSAGGTDILSVILLQRFSIRLGTTVLAFNGIVLASAAAALVSLLRMAHDAENPDQYGHEHTPPLTALLGSHPRSSALGRPQACYSDRIPSAWRSR